MSLSIVFLVCAKVPSDSKPGSEHPMTASATLAFGNPSLGLAKPSPSSFLGVRIHPQSGLLRRVASASRSSGLAVSCTMTKEVTAIEASKYENPGLGLRPDSFGRFGHFGGKYVPETLMYALTELEEAFWALSKDKEFQVGSCSISSSNECLFIVVYFA